MGHNVKVVTDSASSLPAPLARRWGVVVIPHDVIIDGVAHAEGTTVTPGDVVRDLREGRKLSTSQPSTGRFLDAYAAAAASGAKEIVSVHVSGALSGTVNAAEVAAKQAPIPVTVVDSRLVGMGIGFSALAGAALARAGAPAGDVMAEARRVAHSTLVLTTFESLEYLRRGGRVPRTVQALGDALHVRPILSMVGGELAIAARVRTTARAREAMIAMAEAHIRLMERPGIAVMGLDIRQFTDDTTDGFEKRHAELAMVVKTSVGAALAVHGGPGTFAIVVSDLPAALV